MRRLVRVMPLRAHPRGNAIVQSWAAGVGVSGREADSPDAWAAAHRDAHGDPQIELAEGEVTVLCPCGEAIVVRRHPEVTGAVVARHCPVTGNAR